MPQRSVQLTGAPDESIGMPDAKASPVQVMQIDLTQDVLDELLRCTRSGKPPQILFGKTPVSSSKRWLLGCIGSWNRDAQRLELGETTYDLSSSPEHARHELYRYATDVEEGEEAPWEFAGLINHTLGIKRVEQKAGELDQAMEDLKQRMASIDEQKEAGK